MEVQIMARPCDVHVLEDGTRITNQEIKDFTGVTSNGAVRYRLRHAKTKEQLLRKATRAAGRRKQELKIYELSNGDKLTWRDLMLKCGITEASARSRLHASKDPIKVYAHKHQRRFDQANKLKKAMEELEEERKQTKVLFGIPLENKKRNRDQMAPSAMDRCRNQWHLDRDEYGFMNNGDD